MADGEHARALGPPDPFSLPPRSESTPNANDPVGSVGPNVPVAGDVSAQEGAPAGFGSQHVMYDAAFPPPQAQAWAGWPVEWAVPQNTLMGGMLTSDVVFACVDKNGTAVASMPATATDPAGNALAAQPPWLVNPQPEVYTHWAEFVRQVWWSYQLTGEAFIFATSRYLDSGYPRTFTMLAPWLVTAEVRDGVRRYFIGAADATADVLHVRYTSWPGEPRGIGPLEVAKERLLAVKVLGRYGADLAANGGIPWAVLRHKFKLQAGQAEDLKTQWISAARNRMGAPAVLDMDTDLTPLNVTPKDMALSDLQQFAEARIAILLGVPPFLVGLPSGADSLTYSNVSTIYDSHWRQTLRPHSKYLMDALSGWALPGRSAVVLNAEEYIRPSASDRANYYRTMVDIGAMTPDEVRRAERLPARMGEPTA